MVLVAKSPERPNQYFWSLVRVSYVCRPCVLCIMTCSNDSQGRKNNSRTGDLSLKYCWAAYLLNHCYIPALYCEQIKWQSTIKELLWFLEVGQNTRAPEIKKTRPLRPIHFSVIWSFKNYEGWYSINVAHGLVLQSYMRLEHLKL